ncbi:hypothetical protein N7468_010053 [Penicillium chermesinum]|uniref:Complex III subunit 9 n=1 Tax=Penicillium chermesinum TaxID=63820 RepID=A0A9W9NBY8_9EURO|nr:uncharacterized protein N7468_010053 [Penicillium chermesinum]KAJ5217045.1 hypothetical protein N7468_010053 [Penicillium chermesinum]
MAGIANAIYKHVSPSSSDPAFLPITIIRKNAIFMTSIFAGAFAFEIAFDTTSNKIWDHWNAGRQWKDIKPRYMVKEEEEDDE